MSFIPANPYTVTWLLDSLLRAKRALCAERPHDSMVFVLLTKNQEERDKVEQVLMAHIIAKYGQGFVNAMKGELRSQDSTWINIDGISMVLIDLSKTPDAKPYYENTP